MTVTEAVGDSLEQLSAASDLAFAFLALGSVLLKRQAELVSCYKLLSSYNYASVSALKLSSSSVL